MASRSPRFLILDEPLPSSTIHKLLGSFTYDYTMPLDRFVPPQIPDFITEYVIEYGERTAATLVLQHQCSESVRGKLAQIFSLVRSRDASNRYDITSDEIKTYRIHNQDNAFDALMACREIKKQVELLFRRPGHRTNKVYMIVGLKTLLDASAKRERGGQKNGEISLQAPVGAALVAAGAVAGPRLDISAQLQSNADISIATEATHPGEQIFAVEYRVIKKSLLSHLSRSKEDIRFGSTKKWSWGEGVMSAAGDSYSENDSENDEGELLELSRSEVERNGGVLWEVVNEG